MKRVDVTPTLQSFHLHPPYARAVVESMRRPTHMFDSSTEMEERITLVPQAIEF
jgi:hypothetical protein